MKPGLNRKPVMPVGAYASIRYFLTKAPSYLAISLLVSLVLFSPLNAAIIRVSASTGNDTNNGSSWQRAKKTVTAALTASASGDEIWVAAGVYVGRTTLKDGVGLYGGFKGIETQREQRDWRARKSILDGDKLGTVVESPSGVTETTRIDGFSIRNGYTSNGGGIKCLFSNPVIANNHIATNSVYQEGGGIYCESSSPTITNNTIIGNRANAGSGIACANSQPVMINNTVVANSATSRGNAILCNLSSSPLIAGNTIVGNSDTLGFGAVYCNEYCNPTVINNLIAFNSSGIYKYRDFIYPERDSPILKHNCTYGNTAYNYWGLLAGIGDISVDPKLVSWQWGKVWIQPDSPCIDAGDNSAVGSGQTDLDGQARIQGSQVDIGADESDGTNWPPFIPGTVYVSTNGSDSNNGGSWLAAKRTVQAGISVATEIGAQVWVKAGVYKENVTLQPFVELYGGFDGTEVELLQRDWDTHEVILDGKPGDSVIRIITGGRASSRVDGFTIQNGNPPNGNGGGIYCEESWITIENNRIRQNKGHSGGGISCASSGARIINNRIYGNQSVYGGGIYCKAAPYIIGNVIYDNQSERGGGMYCGGWPSRPVIANNTIAMNNGSSDGGGIYFYGSDAVLTNNIISLNSSGLYRYDVYSDGPLTNNNSVYGNTAYNHSGLRPGPGDISVDPLFFNAAGGDFHLQPGSPCIDAGDNSVVQSGWVDMDRDARIFPTGGKVDIGADEFSASIIGSAGEAKTAVDMASIAAQNAVVSAAYNGFFYIQPASHTSGIRVEKAGHGLSVGQLMSLLGTVKTNSNAERYIDATSIAASGTGPVNLVKMNARSVGGDTLGAPPMGQAGVTDGKGLNTVGSLVTISGKITAIAPDRSWITITDKSQWMDQNMMWIPLNDPDGNPGVRCSVPTMLPAEVVVGDMLTITGPVSLTKTGDTILPLILCRSSADVIVH